MARLGLIAGIAASLVLLFVGAQIIAVDRALMPIGSSRLTLSIMNVPVIGLPAYAMGVAWLCGGFALLAHVGSSRIPRVAYRLLTLRNILLVAMAGSFLLAVIVQIRTVIGHWR